MRRGYTLLELLVVVGIIAVLIGLLLPAVQKVRHTVARIQCANHLKQIGLALHQYHDVEGAFPPACRPDNSVEPMAWLSWRVRLMPYLEQAAVWEQTQGNYKTFRVPFFEPHTVMRELQLPGMRCPADAESEGVWKVDRATASLSDYVGVGGERRADRQGVLYHNSRVRLTDMRDGTSNTLAVGERPPSVDKRFSWWYAGVGQDLLGSLDSHQSVREKNVLTWPYYKVCGPGPFAYQAGRADDVCAVFHFWSFHPGGSNFAFADGSVRFVGYGADAVLPALATRAGGEVAALVD